MTPTPDLEQRVKRIREQLAYGVFNTGAGPAAVESRSVVKYLLSAVEALQREIAGRDDARARVFDRFGHTEGGKCACPYCQSDAEALAEMAAYYELDKFSVEQELKRVATERDSAVQQHRTMQAQLEHRTLTLGAAVKRAEAAESRSRQLQEALRDYGQHKIGCKATTPPLGKPCSCGLAALLAAGEREE